MTDKITFILESIDKINMWVGKISGVLTFAFGMILFYGVIMRYLFNSPVYWEPDICWLLFVIMALLAGPYVLQQDFHCRLDLVYHRLSPKGKAVMDIITFPLFIIFIAIFSWYAIEEAYWSTSILERNARSHFHGPIFPAKIAWALASLLLLIQGLAEFTRNVLLLFGIKIKRDIQ